MIDVVADDLFAHRVPLSITEHKRSTQETRRLQRTRQSLR
jgi:hypothetical protein